MSSPDQPAVKEPTQREGNRWDISATLVMACALAALLQGYGDAFWRTSHEVPWGSHWLGIHGLYLAVGTLLGLAAVGLGFIERSVVGWLTTRLFEGRRGTTLTFAFYGLVAVLLSYGTAFWTFSGAAIQKTLWRWLGPPLFLAAVFALAFGLAFLVTFVRQRSASGRPGPARLLAGSCLIAAAGFSFVDQTYYQHLYERLHEYLEWLALLALGVGSWVLLDPLSNVLWRRQFKKLAASGLCLWLMSCFLFHGVREGIDSRLTHAWLDPIHAGRMLKRAQELEAWLRAPLSEVNIAMLRLERLESRYEIRDTTLAQSWRAPSQLTTAEPVPPRSQDYNVVVFYVDTLRYDVALDPEIMPNVVGFARESLNFRRAYATGSDTLRSLPGLTGGNYFVRNTHSGDLCEVAKKSGHRSALFIAKSAHQFLQRLRPNFELDEVFDVADYAEGREVWGYGADQPSASGIVDEALAYLEKNKAKKSFLWLFHFDQHNWRELDDEYLDVVRTKYKVPTEGQLNSRYRAVASAIDGEFSRFRDGLAELGLSDKTVILFVSDHGEGLGAGGFWVHSVFLWETLVHVPLLLKVPGIAPREVNSVVSLVDVAPTLTRFLEPNPKMSGYHGEDLLRHASGKVEPRRFPVLFAAALRDRLVRVGMVTDKGDAKLVVRLEAALPELHDLAAADPDARSVADAHPKLTRSMLRELARSPIFPRSTADFPMLEPKGEMSFAEHGSSLTLRTE